MIRSVLKQRLFDALTGLVPLVTRAVDEVDWIARIVILQRLPRERVIPAPPPVNDLPLSQPKLYPYLQIRQQGTDNRAREEPEAGDKDERRLLQQHSNTAGHSSTPRKLHPHTYFLPLVRFRIYAHRSFMGITNLGLSWGGGLKITQYTPLARTRTSIQNRHELSVQVVIIYEHQARRIIKRRLLRLNQETGR